MGTVRGAWWRKLQRDSPVAVLIKNFVHVSSHGFLELRGMEISPNGS